MPRLLVIMGSGETAPTMVTIHKDLLAALPGGMRESDALLVETPYGFQENADDVSERARGYFATSVGLSVAVAPGLRAPASAPEPATDRGLAGITSARWLFAGPGSPTYALTQWQGSAAAAALRARINAPDATSVTIFSSAAACTVGAFALPVYEVYKAGEAPRWRDGLDLTASFGLPAVVIPHYDNAEGGTHDTRFCYMGERRLALLEEQLPEGIGVFGVDEHTAAVVDLDSATLTVRGRGGVTIRHQGTSLRYESGTVAELSAVAAALHGEGDGGGAAGTGVGRTGTAEDPSQRAGSHPPASTLSDAVAALDVTFAAAARAGDLAALAETICELDRVIVSWSADTLQSDELDRAHATLRSMVIRLGDAGAARAGDPTTVLAPVVEPLLGLRASLRSQQQFAVADEVRDALLAGGLELRDTPDGSSWSVASPPARAATG